MKIISKETTKSGIKIQIEDWSETYKHHAYGDTLVLFPIAKSSLYQNPNCTYPESGKKFRLEFWFNSYEQCQKAYIELVFENKTPQDYALYATHPRYLEVL